tara:strand:- start:1585 stop:2145 length:561 start_codon:yes stop_codon:yes gene_type:complete
MSNGQRLAYIRVSTVEQNIDRQLHGHDFDEKFVDKCTGSNTNRVSLDALKTHCRKGDSVHVHSIDRLARNLVDLLGLINFFVDKGVSVEFYKEGLVFTGEDNPFQNLQLQIIGSCAEFERSMINARIREGIQVRKSKGLPVGRKSVVDDNMRKRIIKADDDGVSKTEIANHEGVGRATVYRVLSKT